MGEKEVLHLFFPSLTQPIQEASSPSPSSVSLRVSASQRGTFDVSERIRCDMTQ